MGEVVGQIVTSLGQDALLLRSFVCEERFSEPFRITCEVISAGPVDFGPVLGGGVSLTVGGGVALVDRDFHGILTGASRISEDNDSVHYRLELRPWFWLLSLGRNSRIFQAQSAMTIIQQVFNDAGVSTSAYQSNVAQAGSVVRNYCVQYEESDMDFVSRIMEEEGIYYFFQHSSNSHVMILCDGKSSHSAFSGGDLPMVRNDQSSSHIGSHLWRWDEHFASAANSIVLRDFHLLKFEDALEATNTATAASSITGEVFHYPGEYSHLADDASVTGANYALLRLQAAQAEQLRYGAAGDTFAVPVGSLVTMQPVTGQSDDAVTVLVTSAVHSFDGQAFAAQAQRTELTLRLVMDAVPSDIVWRPARKTPKPVAKGPTTAVVVGPAGEVIHVDQYGRVRVQFPWDRLGNNDETSGCWIRVSQGWADGAFGQIHIPRIGEEVIVDHFDGDMDRPVITGRVYNSSRMVPYALPDNKTQSGWKSQTVGDSGEYPDTVDPPPTTTPGFNEFRMEDKGGSEEIYVHAQRLFTAWYRFDETRTTGHNTTIKVGYNRDITIKNNESKTVSEGDETHTISQGSLTTTITQGDETRSVSTGKRTTTIKSDEALTVSSGNMSTTVSEGNQSTTVSQGNQSTTVSQGNQSTDVTMGNISVKADAGSISIQAMQKIELVVGTNSVTIDMTGVTIKGTMISSEAETIHKVAGDAMTQITGGVVMIN